MLDINNVKYKKNNYGKYILNIGRLTKQKNQELLIKSFKKINLNHKNLKLLILGEGENLLYLKNLVQELKLESKVIFLGHIKDPRNLIKNSLCIIVSSLWEDPGFVMIEGAANKKIIISSDCPNGPREFFNNGKNGFLFKNNNSKSLIDTFEKFLKTNPKDLQKKIMISYKNSKKYLYVHHSKMLNYLLIKNEKKQN